MFKLIVIAVLYLSFSSLSAVENDSISTVTKNGQTVILYEVGPKETMYSIARKYNIPPKSIVAINPEIQNTGLKVGQKIFVPYETARITKSANTIQKEEIPGVVYHTVEKGQTLYTVARVYKVSVDDLRKWNNLIDSDLKSGMKLIVDMSNEIIKQPSIEVVNEPLAKTTQSKTGYDKVLEKGKAEMFETNEGDEYYYVLHKNIPIGTVIKIINEENNMSIYARVIGKLIETNDKYVILKMSKLAYSTLGGKTSFLKIQIEFVPQ
jgi:LysM repeat protein